MISMTIKLFITGGTIDCEKIDPATKKYSFTETHLPEMLKEGRNRVDVELEVLMLKDSIYMTDSDREKILQKCKSCKEDNKEFTFDEAKNILKDDSRIVALVLSELKTTDWLESKKDPKDARKKIYSLIHTDVVEKMVKVEL